MKGSLVHAKVCLFKLTVASKFLYLEHYERAIDMQVRICVMSLITPHNMMLLSSYC